MANFQGLQPLDLNQPETSPASVRPVRQASPLPAALLAKFGGASPVRRFPISPATNTPLRRCFASSPAPASASQSSRKLPPRIPPAASPTLTPSNFSTPLARWSKRTPDLKVPATASDQKCSATDKESLHVRPLMLDTDHAAATKAYPNSQSGAIAASPAEFHTPFSSSPSPVAGPAQSHTFCSPPATPATPAAPLACKSPSRATDQKTSFSPADAVAMVPEGGDEKVGFIEKDMQQRPAQPSEQKRGVLPQNPMAHNSQRGTVAHGSPISSPPQVRRVLEGRRQGSPVPSPTKPALSSKGSLAWMAGRVPPRTPEEKRTLNKTEPEEALGPPARTPDQKESGATQHSLPRSPQSGFPRHRIANSKPTLCCETAPTASPTQNRSVSVRAIPKGVLARNCPPRTPDLNLTASNQHSAMLPARGFGETRSATQQNAQLSPSQPTEQKDSIVRQSSMPRNSQNGTAAHRSSFSSPSPSQFHGERSVETPTRRRQANGASEPVCVLGVGTGGIEELSKSLDDRSVCWALLRFQVGSGTFQRTKLVAVHCNGEDTPIMLRGWLNARGAEVFTLLGEVHANVVATRAKEVTVENLCQRLLPLFSSDHMSFSLTSLSEQYTKTVEEEASRRRLKAQAAEEAPPPVEPLRKPVEPVVATAAEALTAVGADRGSCNWVLLEARTLQLHSSGFGGLEDLKAHLAENQVLFGALRLSFGSGITKHIFVHWQGPRVSVVQRGLLNAHLARAAETVGQYCSVVFRREAHGLKDLQLEDVVSDLRSLTVIDGISAASGVAAGRISAAEYLAALKEETAARERESRRSVATEVVPTPVLPATAEEETAPNIEKVIDVKDAIHEVRKTSGDWNWVLCGWERPEPKMPPPSPCRGGA